MPGDQTSKLPPPDRRGRGSAFVKPRVRIVIIPRESLALPEVESDAVGQFLTPNRADWKVLNAEFGILEMSRLISSATRHRINEVAVRIRERNKLYSRPAFTDYFMVEAGTGIDAGVLIDRLKRWPNVRDAYLAPDSERPGVVVPTSANGLDPYFDEQYYLRRTPYGIGAEALWARLNGQDCSGADGQGAELVDMENGFNPDHEDLVEHFRSPGANSSIPLTGCNDLTEASHGTAVLGIICARNNHRGCCGITPNLSRIGLASSLEANGSICWERPISEVLSDIVYYLSLRPGGVILIEHQLLGTRDIPYGTAVELALDNYEAIQFACDAGCIVIEPAGNGGADLDHTAGPSLPDINSIPSGAIMVAASRMETDGASGYWPGGREYCHVPLHSGDGDRTTFGSRVDCFAPGENLRTCGATPNTSTTPISFQNDEYRDDFGKTSGAAAIIAGVALSVQGIVLARYGVALKPDRMRWLLTNNQYATISKNGQQDRIGVMPDLEKIERALQNLNQSPLNWLLT